ncbi:hypothetical protein KKD19_05680 [Patescibacteria group bacterium]|nr:hypothetical protein [Patescibacteria group bacterium]MBU4512695.1 hypothetical protein [Patescibacteria group bacterium]MCG2693597.1 hypothetical protein [Candidatus Parcubacteria bacterium]
MTAKNAELMRAAAIFKEDPSRRETAARDFGKAVDLEVTEAKDFLHGFIKKQKEWQDTARKGGG